MVTWVTVACSDSGNKQVDAAVDAQVCETALFCDGLVAMERNTDCTEVEVETCTADTQQCVEGACLMLLGQPCAADDECVSGRCAGPAGNTTCTDGSLGQSCDDEADCQAEAPLCLDNRCEACEGDCTGYTCGTDCRGVCEPGCSGTDICDVAADLVDDHGDALLLAMGGVGLLVPVPTVTQDLVTYTAHICPDGGCYLWVELDASPLAPTDTNRVDATALVTFWTADANGDPDVLPITVVFGTIGETDCEATVDTRTVAPPSNALSTAFVTDNDSGANDIYFQGPTDTTIQPLDPGDFTMAGGVQCDVGSMLSGLFTNILISEIEAALDLASRTQVCAVCADSSDCPADAPCDGVHCVRDGDCLASELAGVCVAP